jgi:hypothetical protein
LFLVAFCSLVPQEVQKKTRAAFGKACKAAGLPDDQVDVLRASLELEQMQEITEEFAKDPKSKQATDLFTAYITRIQEEETKRKSMSAAQLAEDKAAQKKLEESREAAAAKSWTHEEEAMLTRAVTKFPPGSLLRWESITDMVNTITSRNVKDVIKRAKMSVWHAGRGESERAAGCSSCAENCSLLPL